MLFFFFLFRLSFSNIFFYLTFPRSNESKQYKIRKKVVSSSSSPSTTLLLRGCFFYIFKSSVSRKSVEVIHFFRRRKRLSSFQFNYFCFQNFFLFPFLLIFIRLIISSDTFLDINVYTCI